MAAASVLASARLRAARSVASPPISRPARIADQVSAPESASCWAALRSPTPNAVTSVAIAGTPATSTAPTWAAVMSGRRPWKMLNTLSSLRVGGSGEQRPVTGAALELVPAVVLCGTPDGLAAVGHEPAQGGAPLAAVRG